MAYSTTEQIIENAIRNDGLTPGNLGLLLNDWECDYNAANRKVSITTQEKNKILLENYGDDYQITPFGEMIMKDFKRIRYLKRIEEDMGIDDLALLLAVGTSYFVMSAQGEPDMLNALGIPVTQTQEDKETVVVTGAPSKLEERKPGGGYAVADPPTETVDRKAKSYGLTLCIAQEAIDSDRTNAIMTQITDFSQSMRLWRPQLLADRINAGLSTTAGTNAIMADGLEYFSASHVYNYPGSDGATYSNLSTAALEVAAIQRCITTITKYKNMAGFNAGVKGYMLLVPADLQVRAEMILKQNLNPATPTAVLNSNLFVRGALPGGYLEWDMLSTTTGWYIMTTYNNRNAWLFSQIKAPFTTNEPRNSGKSFETNSINIKCDARGDVRLISPLGIFFNNG